MFVTLQIWAKNKRFYINLVQGEFQQLETKEDEGQVSL